MKAKRPLPARHMIALVVADHGDRGLVVVTTTKRAACCANTNECRASAKGVP